MGDSTFYVSRVRDPPYIQVQVYWTVLIFCVDFPLHRWCESIFRIYSCSGILRSQQMNLQRWTNLSARMFRRACGPSWSSMPAHGITSMWMTYLLSLPGKSKHWCSEGVFNRSKSVSTSPIKMKSRIRSWSVSNGRFSICASQSLVFYSRFKISKFSRIVSCGACFGLAFLARDVLCLCAVSF